ncbi:TIGR03986 family CRISPR-associated RAMP protein [candidate division KSB1 bacterium]|nr:TIGR03986 family CRISPR-associated RAMP protein [candidate division KSB1 bacterium]
MPDKYNIVENETFVNPYNFIPLQQKCTKGLNYRTLKKEGTLTGWLNCELTTLTPVFVPNTTSVFEDHEGKKRSHVFPDAKDKDGNKINSYDFYSYTDLGNEQNPDFSKSPVIPGSEIRGVIRTAFEAVTNSCMSTIDKEKSLYKRTVKVGAPGILKNESGVWKIFPCKRIGIAKRPANNDSNNFSSKINSLKEGQKVYIKIGGTYRTRRHFPAFDFVGDIQDNKVSDEYIEGYFHAGEPFQRKHHESIFILKNCPEIKVEKKAVEELLENLKLYQDESVNLEYKKITHKGYKKIGNASDMSIMDLNDKLVYYSSCATKTGIKYYLSPAAIGREVFHNTLEDLIGLYNHQPCEKLDDLCPACALFGMTAKENSAASRVRFTDATCIDTPYFDDPVTLKELASPKISATEFYLKKKNNNHDMWNYDYAMNWNSLINGDPNYTPEIRGRKFYWHQKNPDYIETDEITERNVHVRPLKKANRFSFKVYFNNITTKELNTLIWILEIGGDKQQAHKLGMGKPIGLGSVRISVTDINIREMVKKDDTIEYKKKDNLPKDQYKNFGDLLINDMQLEQFKTITNFDQAPDNVSYPYVTNEDETFRWFVANKLKRENAMKPSISQELPGIDNALDKEKGLHPYRKVPND